MMITSWLARNDLHKTQKQIVTLTQFSKLKFLPKKLFLKEKTHRYFKYLKLKWPKNEEKCKNDYVRPGFREIIMTQIC